MNQEEVSPIKLVLKAQKTFFPSFSQKLDKIEKDVNNLQQQVSMLVLNLQAVLSFINEYQDVIANVFQMFRGEIEKEQDQQQEGDQNADMP